MSLPSPPGALGGVGSVKGPWQASLVRIARQRRNGVPLALINSWAAAQERVREGRAAVVLQWTEQWIGVYLVRRVGQNGAAIIAAEVVPARDDRARAVRDAAAGSTGFQNSVPDLQCSTIVDAAAIGGRVAAEGASTYRQRPTVENAASAAAADDGGITAKGWSASNRS